MAEKEQPKQPTHRAYSVIRREGQDDFWLNLGLVFEHSGCPIGMRCGRGRLWQAGTRPPAMAHARGLPGVALTASPQTC